MKFQIENYENMTTEEKLAALEAYEPDMSGFVAKAVFDKKASEAADLSKQLKARMTEEEKAKEAEAKHREELEARVKELETEKAINANVNSYLAMGYDEKLARSSAEALVKGDMETVFKNQKAHLEVREKALKADLLKQTPFPAGGESAPTVTKEQFDNMSFTQRADLKVKNPELYKTLNGGN